MEPLYYTNAHNDYFKSISKRLKLQRDKDKKNRSSITSFSLPALMTSGLSLSTSNSSLANESYKLPFKKPGLFGSGSSGSIVNSTLTSNGSTSSSPSLKSPISTSSSASKAIILMAIQDFKARNKNEVSVSTKEHLRLISRKGNGLVLVKPIGRLSRPGLLPTSVVKIVDVGNPDQRHLYDANWLNTSESTSIYEKANLGALHNGDPYTNSNNIYSSANTNVYSSANSSIYTSANSSPASNQHKFDYSPSYHGTPSRSGSLSVSKPTPINYLGGHGISTTPEAHYSYESKGQYSKESNETVNSFEKDLKRSNSVSTIGSTVSSIHSLSFRKPLSNCSSPDLSDLAGLENDINRTVEEDDFDDVEDEDLTGFDQEHCSPPGLHNIEDVCVSNVYNNNGRYWYKVEIFYRNGNKRFLRRYYQDFYDLHTNILACYRSISSDDATSVPKMPGPIPRPDPNNPSKALLQRCHDLNVYFRQLFERLNEPANDVFAEWVYPRFGDYDMNGNDPATASLDNSIVFERPIIASDDAIADNESNIDIEPPVQKQFAGLGSPKICVPKAEQAPSPMDFNNRGNNNTSIANPYFQTSPNTRPPRSPLANQGSPMIRQQSINKNLPPIPLGGTVPSGLLTPGASRHQLYGPHPTPVSAQQASPFSHDDDDEESVPTDKSNNDIMQEIESELNMQNVSIVNVGQTSTLSMLLSSKNGRAKTTTGDGTEVAFSQHQISGPQIRVKVFYNDGEDIFMTKVPVSASLAQLKNKIFTRIKDDFAKRNRKLNTSDIFLFSKDSNGMYTAIKDDLGLRGVVRTANGKFSVRVEFD